MHYIAIIHKESGSDFGVSFPDFPGCITAGTSLDEAKDMASEALLGHIEVMQDEGLEIPSPSSLDHVMQDPDFRDGVAFLVHYKQPEKLVRINISMTQSELAAIDEAVRQIGTTRSAYLVKAGLGEIR
jgi:predicted RNase H-like HicB family nuclease